MTATTDKIDDKSIDLESDIRGQKLGTGLLTQLLTSANVVVSTSKSAGPASHMCRVTTACLSTLTTPSIVICYQNSSHDPSHVLNTSMANCTAPLSKQSDSIYSPHIAPSTFLVDDHSEDHRDHQSSSLQLVVHAAQHPAAHRDTFTLETSDVTSSVTSAAGDMALDNIITVVSISDYCIMCGAALKQAQSMFLHQLLSVDQRGGDGGCGDSGDISCERLRLSVADKLSEILQVDCRVYHDNELVCVNCFNVLVQIQHLEMETQRLKHSILDNFWRTSHSRLSHNCKDDSTQKHLDMLDDNNELLDKQNVFSSNKYRKIQEKNDTPTKTFVQNVGLLSDENPADLQSTSVCKTTSHPAIPPDPANTLITPLKVCAITTSIVYTHIAAAEQSAHAHTVSPRGSDLSSTSSTYTAQPQTATATTSAHLAHVSGTAHTANTLNACRTMQSGTSDVVSESLICATGLQTVSDTRLRQISTDTILSDRHRLVLFRSAHSGEGEEVQGKCEGAVDQPLIGVSCDPTAGGDHSDKPKDGHRLIFPVCTSMSIQDCISPSYLNCSTTYHHPLPVSSPPASSYADFSSKERKCSKCHMTFGTLTDYLRHRRIMHDRRVTCETCGKVLSARNLSSHLAIHSDTRNFVCHMCGASFKAKNSLETHLRTHSEDRPFTCGTCGRAFRHRNNCKDHERSHSNLRNFVCPICTKRFKQAKNLKQHARSQHPDKSGVFPELYTCPHCQSTFKYKYNMIAHVKTLHTGELSRRKRRRRCEQPRPAGDCIEDSPVTCKERVVVLETPVEHECGVVDETTVSITPLTSNQSVFTQNNGQGCVPSSAHDMVSVIQSHDMFYPVASIL